MGEELHASSPSPEGRMTPQDIIAKLFMPVDKERIQKAQGLAIRAKIDWQRVLDAMTDEQRKAVEQANA